jgi:hypothetical protein
LWPSAKAASFASAGAACCVGVEGFSRAEGSIGAGPQAAKTNQAVRLRISGLDINNLHFSIILGISFHSSLTAVGFTKTELPGKAQHQPVFTTAGHSELEPMTGTVTLPSTGYLVPE